MLVGLCLIATKLPAQKLFKWVDDEGVVHYTDHIPPEFAHHDRDVLNTQGVTVGFEEGEITEEERARYEREQAIAAAEQLARDDAARRDQMLLDTYLSVADIEDLRDRRLELIDSQIRVTEFYLSNLRKRLESLEKERDRMASSEDGNGPVPEYLALDISRTEASIALYEQRLQQSRSDQEDLRHAFNADIERFQELRGG